jgi:hypothetical protein
MIDDQNNLGLLNESNFTVDPVYTVRYCNFAQVMLSLKKTLNVVNNREMKLINEINLGSYIIITVEILLFLAIILYIYTKINLYINIYKIGKIGNITQTMYRNNEPDINYLYISILSAVFTVILLILFQIIFYFYGISFRYLGYYGPEEIIVQFMETANG